MSYPDMQVLDGDLSRGRPKGDREVVLFVLITRPVEIIGSPCGLLLFQVEAPARHRILDPCPANSGSGSHILGGAPSTALP